MRTSKTLSENLLFIHSKIEEETIAGKQIKIELETLPKLNLPAKISLKNTPTKQPNHTPNNNTRRNQNNINIPTTVSRHI